jgi:guanosine-3',5'-bis(diphosphate) 3'-pyrophosphohydrolase
VENGKLLKAIEFAAQRHRDQRRKNSVESPYINHPIAVANILAQIGEVQSDAVLAAAILHDTIEDTDTTATELSRYFGESVSRLVKEVTDDKSLPKAKRKELQIEHAPDLSVGAVLIKLGDKIHNVGEIANDPPPHWPLERRVEYVSWAESVIANCPRVNQRLEQEFESVARAAKQTLLKNSDEA